MFIINAMEIPNYDLDKAFHLSQKESKPQSTDKTHVGSLSW